jgi:hypothetical protein
MASHDGLRLYFGKYAPDEVLRHIFSYGFHLWLGETWEVMIYIHAEGRRHRGFSTRRYVMEHQLSAEALTMVDHHKYTHQTFHNPHGDEQMEWTTRERPYVWMHPVVYLHAYGEFWAVPTPCFDPVRIRQPPPQTDDYDIDDELEAYRDMLVDRFANYGW